ncbi:MAG TPA: DnaJ domain-containing protein [Bacteroidales bacterium]|jgi:DnaJ like chaperone protein|nr:DnaJ domain-containing protein [Bacteroidales bacterium]HPE40973.1 DnaJ domain-containing protein [Bacteroidales bacterium]
MFKLIIAIIGFITGGIGGAFIGFIIGSIVDSISSFKVIRSGYFSNQDNFLDMLLRLTSAIVKSDNSGTMLKSELNFVKDYLVRSFGPSVATSALYQLREYLNEDIDIPTLCHNFSKKATIHEKLILLQFLFGLSASDGKIETNELNMIQNISDWIGVSRNDFESLKAMFFARQYQYKYQQQSSYNSSSSSYSRSFESLDNDYKILEITSSASDEDVKKAYRKQAMKHHPDKVNHLGDEVRKSAEEKFRLLNQSYERIKKSRGIN